MLVALRLGLFDLCLELQREIDRRIDKAGDRRERDDQLGRRRSGERRA